MKDAPATNVLMPTAEQQEAHEAHVGALHREAAGYIARANWHGLECVNNSLEAIGEKPIPKPAAAKATSKSSKT